MGQETWWRGQWGGKKEGICNTLNHKDLKNQTKQKVKKKNKTLPVKEKEQNNN